MQRKMAAPGVSRRTEDEVARSDRRWLLAIIAVFTISLSTFFGAYQLYRVTGPHPEITLFLRRAKGLAKQILPRWRKSRKWQ
jgi:hypothetical protein